MSIGVVDALKVINIEHRDGHWVPRFAGEQQRLLKHEAGAAPVCNSGKLVRLGQNYRVAGGSLSTNAGPFHLGFVRNLGRDVLDNAEQANRLIDAVSVNLTLRKHMAYLPVGADDASGEFKTHAVFEGAPDMFRNRIPIVRVIGVYRGVE